MRRRQQKDFGIKRLESKFNFEFFICVYLFSLVWLEIHSGNGCWSWCACVSYYVVSFLARIRGRIKVFKVPKSLCIWFEFCFDGGWQGSADAWMIFVLFTPNESFEGVFLLQRKSTSVSSTFSRSWLLWLLAFQSWVRCTRCSVLHSFLFLYWFQPFMLYLLLTQTTSYWTKINFLSLTKSS